jgi:catechol 2,3-dioxygenase-like lactoylglutathione lyase family enzyme
MIAVEDIAWIRYSAPDLDLMETFLADFGMHRAERTEDTLFMRGCGREPFIHVTEKGPCSGIGFAFRAQSPDDLMILARTRGAEVATRDEPGGGQVARLADPDGNRIEIVHGASGHTAPAREPFPFNASSARLRLNRTIRWRARPSQVQRLGHVALFTTRFEEMRSFYIDVLGMRISDSYHTGSAGNPFAHFLHCGQGERFVDHHSVALIAIGRTGFEHSAFEVTDLDDLMSGHEYLASTKRWKHSWGVGRHVEGSQVFDYWRDPFGNKIEHWTDGDLVNDDYAGSSVEFDPDSCLSQWGPAPSTDFMA